MLALAGAVFAFCPAEPQAERRRFICGGRKTENETAGWTLIYLRDDLIIFGSGEPPVSTSVAPLTPSLSSAIGGPFPNLSPEARLNSWIFTDRLHV